MVPLYCFDPRQYITTPHGNPKTGGYRAQFLLESVQDLKQSLRHIGSDLMVCMGTPEEAVQGLTLCSSVANLRKSLEGHKALISYRTCLHLHLTYVL